MTVKERVGQAIRLSDMNRDDVNKIIALAYFMGRESATRQIADKYNDLINKNLQNKLGDANSLDPPDEPIKCSLFIYSSDYRGEMTRLFGNDETAM